MVFKKGQTQLASNLANLQNGSTPLKGGIGSPSGLEIPTGQKMAKICTTAVRQVQDNIEHKNMDTGLAVADVIKIKNFFTL